MKMGITGFEITTRGEGENSVISAGDINEFHEGITVPEGWVGVILADHGFVAVFCNAEAAYAFLDLALAEDANAENQPSSIDDGLIEHDLPEDALETSLNNHPFSGAISAGEY